MKSFPIMLDLERKKINMSDFTVIKKIDMRGSLGKELDYYENASYKPEYAIAEFVDNSVASYLKDKVLLLMMEPDFKLRIEIEYDVDRNILTVKDNAGGMDEATFEYAMVLGNPPTTKNGLNEFGRGLKSAASWFGKKWSVTSTTFNSEYAFKAFVDIKNLLVSKDNDVPMSSIHVDKKAHYTVVKIWDLTKTISRSNISKLEQQLASIYRRFLVKNEIEITFNGEPLEYNEPECLKLTENGIDRLWRYEFDEVVSFNGKDYPISGFVGLLKEGSYKVAGLTLIRRNRVILGGFEKGYKPHELFGAANSPISLRFFGEVNMDKWPVTQAKDNFDWDMNGLQDAFIEKMKKIAAEFLQKAKSYRATSKKTHITPVKAQEIYDRTTESLKNMGPDSNVKVLTPETINPVEIKTQESGEDITEIHYSLSISNNDYKITVEFLNDVEADLVIVTPKLTDPTNITITFNTAFPMFQQWSTNVTFVTELEKFFIALVIAEEQSLRFSDDGVRVKPAFIRENLNQVLLQMQKEGVFNRDEESQD